MKTTHSSISKSNEARQILQAGQRLDRDFSGEFVAYLDSWKKTKNGKKLARKILAHAHSLKEINDVLADLPSWERRKIVLHFAQLSPPNLLEVHFDLLGR